MQTYHKPYSGVVRVGIVAPNGSQAIDFMGPIDAFNEANRSVNAPVRYQVDLIGVRAGPIVSSSGIRILPDKIIGPNLNCYDTILVTGGLDFQATIQERVLLDWLVSASPSARRIGSICNGAFALAEAGLPGDARQRTGIRRSTWLRCFQVSASSRTACLSGTAGFTQLPA